LHNDRGISLPNCIAKLNERLIKHYENLFAEIFNMSILLFFLTFTVSCHL
jgi:hypothetical protein